jgi:hypothetical protein
LDDVERKLIRNLQTHDLAEHLRLRRAQQAKSAGLPVEEFAQPFPGHHSTTIIRTEGPGLSARWLTTAAVLGLFGTGAWLVHLLGVARPVPEPAPPDPVELRVRWWIEDGQVKAKVE